MALSSRSPTHGDTAPDSLAMPPASKEHPKNRGSSRKSERTSLSPVTSPAKTRTCKQCQRPRVGHPRSGCPFADESGSPRLDLNDRASIESAFKALRIGVKTNGEASPVVDFVFAADIEQTAPFPAPAEPSPKAAEASGKAGGRSRGSKVKEALHTATSPRKPATAAPSALNIQNESPHSPAVHGELPPQSDSLAPADSNKRTAWPEAATDSRSISRPKPLTRAPSMSMDEQDVLLDHVLKSPAADVHVLKHEIRGLPDLFVRAGLKGVTALIVPTSEAVPERGIALIALGKDKSLVEEVVKIGAQKKEAVKAELEDQERKGRYPVLRYAGVALLGAVACWTGLAFS
ncbi:hypothetical protein WOLCODRAFT_143308 [Wolfiporia cocos MD-104 SS10]|uniref:Uncharacterized protein n=1 Tax=Wolfiporia cocos (strain MD-104) TaxID=742152 RepID=A0A2H3JFF5_WOLCO|nr:hypothetical protein WOLCODRAFT_143308 [Wolfiporia cocos MD-104 SS10]